MDRIEQLVAVLYQPGVAPGVVEQAQRELQQVQKSESGWELAGVMLASANANTQFLGAQTLMVKLKAGTDLPPLAAQRSQVLDALKQVISRGSPLFVSRKILSVLTKMFLNSDWPEGVASILTVVGTGSPLCYDFLDSLVEDSELPPANLRAKLVPQVSQIVLELLANGGLANERAVKTFEVWTMTFLDQFKPALGDLVNLMTHSFYGADDLCVAVIRCTDNLYSYESRLWPPETKMQLSRALQSLTAAYPSVPADFADDEKFLALAELVMTYCNEDFSETALHPFIVEIARANNAPVVDDPLAIECVGFWNQYTEDIISSGFSTSSNSVILTVISNYWPRIRIYDGLRPSDWEEFASFRTDFADFLELAYPLLGSQLFTHLADLVLISLEEMDWYGIESAMYCLNALADFIGDDYQGQRPELMHVQRIFQSDLWAKLPQCDNFRVKQTAVNLIGCFVDFFASPGGNSYLAVTLNYLFSCLGEQPLQNTASRAIQKLCDTCRTLLTGEISAFITVYGQIRSKLMELPHVRTVSAIAYVAQAQPTVVAQAAALETLLDLILSTEVAELNADEIRQLQFKCVAAVGKGFKETSAAPAAPAADVIEFWQNNEVSARIRTKIQGIIGCALETRDLTTVEAICDIVKAGMSEQTGPFVLEEQLATSFIVAKFRAGPEQVLTPVLDLAKFYIMCQRAAVKTHKPLAPGGVLEIAQMLDVELSIHLLSAALDVLTQLVLLASTCETTLANLGPLNVLRHAYAGLTTNDRFVLKSAVSFWKEFLQLNPLPADQATPLVQLVVVQISSEATRSELPAFVDIVKYLVSKHPLVTSTLLKHFVVSAPETLNLQRLDTKTRSDYVSQLFLLKGGRRTFDITQKFWQACRNIPDSYDPNMS